jgi:hypothetical protein
MNGMSARYARRGLYVFGLAAMVWSAVAPAEATAAVVPEIDGGTVSMGLGLLAAGALMLRARMRK